MNFDCCHYVPCLRWKQGEYQALLQLSEDTKNYVTPLVEVPEMGYDFETGLNEKSVDKHLAPFAKRVRVKWQQRACFVDVKLIGGTVRMADGSHPVKFIFDGLRHHVCLAIPVTGISRSAAYCGAVSETVSKDKRGLCIRIGIEESASPSLRAGIDALLSNNGVKAEECDLVLDLGAPNFVPIDGFTKVIDALIRELPYLAKWRTLTVIGTSFPPSMAEIRNSPAQIERREWLLYKRLVANLSKANIRIPTFGDYAVSHPDVSKMDMRIMKPSATIRYTSDDAWLIVKGPNVREYGFGQYRNHCQTVINSPHYSGPEFSAGDAYISNCANGSELTGNLTTWRRVGTNHHIEKVKHDIANLFSP